jgi:bifunctional DNA-binding transcriptional regulator/antitoxin component of YhaV-PrlF toxin-antitoxin module
MKNNVGYVSTIYADGDDYYIVIPEEVLAKMDWKEKDVLEWAVDDTNQITIKKILDYSKEV